MFQLSLSTTSSSVKLPGTSAPPVPSEAFALALADLLGPVAAKPEDAGTNSGKGRQDAADDGKSLPKESSSDESTDPAAPAFGWIALAPPAIVAPIATTVAGVATAPAGAPMPTSAVAFSPTGPGTASAESPRPGSAPILIPMPIRVASPSAPAAVPPSPNADLATPKAAPSFIAPPKQDDTDPIGADAPARSAPPPRAILAISADTPPPASVARLPNSPQTPSRGAPPIAAARQTRTAAAAIPGTPPASDTPPPMPPITSPVAAAIPAQRRSSEKLAAPVRATVAPTPSAVIPNPTAVGSAPTPAPATSRRAEIAPVIELPADPTVGGAGRRLATTRDAPASLRAAAMPARAEAPIRASAPDGRSDPAIVAPAGTPPAPNPPLPAGTASAPLQATPEPELPAGPSIPIPAASPPSRTADRIAPHARAPDSRPSAPDPMPVPGRATPAPQPQPPARPAAIVFGVALPGLFGAAPRAPTGNRREQTDAITSGIAAAATVTMRSVAVTAAAGPSHDALDMRRDDWPQAMIDRIETLRDAADATDTRIRLAPDALGTVQVSLRHDGDAVHVHFTADAAATRTLIADAQPRLAELAQARGLRMSQATVDSGGAGTGQHRHAPTPQPHVPLRPATARVSADAIESFRLA